MEPPGNDAVAFESAEKIVLRWDSTTSEEAKEKMILEGNRQEIDQYLQAVDEIQRSMESTTLLDDDQSKANSAIQIAMARLEDEFRNILIAHTSAIEVELLSNLNSSSSSINYSAASRTTSGEMNLGDEELKSIDGKDGGSVK